MLSGDLLGQVPTLAMTAALGYVLSYVIQRQQQELLELSTPVVKLWEGILAVPLIGTLDSARTQVVMESLLQALVETGESIGSSLVSSAGTTSIGFFIFLFTDFTGVEINGNWTLTVSDNTAANRLIHRVGIERVNGHDTYRTRLHVRGGIPLARVDTRMESWIDVDQLFSRRFEQDQHELNFKRHRIFDLSNAPTWPSSASPALCPQLSLMILN